MKRSALPPRKFALSSIMVFGCSLLSLCFVWHTNKQRAIFWSNKCLAQAFDTSGDAKLKSWTLNLTDDSFMRLRKIYQGGRQEYFSFNLHRLSDISYLGTETNGVLRIHTKADDIIVQTYQDPKGDVDSMSTMLSIPVRNVTAGQLDSLRNTLLYLKAQ
ncbi:hypothetical protein KHS38_06020 [Mucilaginibacter sp. Bleaf8]|uniref:hypothetical protein n=1 Tax=Mucilaginibacter sp. Bleaf8 TaxID=2834430 RepID=UPI001BCCD6E9|nr:hypothetical protein [Mucilaginibacter sp. Bleaf8]MBS7563955.1 hypothetical protein [Mucilaginibacter sp. Bleaf8]